MILGASACVIGIETSTGPTASRALFDELALIHTSSSYRRHNPSELQPELKEI
jgi:hypothetical protein